MSKVWEMPSLDFQYKENQQSHIIRKIKRLIKEAQSSGMRSKLNLAASDAKQQIGAIMLWWNFPKENN